MYFCADSLSLRPHASLSIRVNSSSGLIFHVAGGKNQRTMTLSVFDGHLMLLVNGGKRKTTVRSRKKYNDASWHTVRMWLGFSKRISFSQTTHLYNELCRCLWKWKVTGPLWRWMESTFRTRERHQVEGGTCLELHFSSEDFHLTTVQHR